MLKVQTVGELQWFLKMGIYGPAGAGKTTWVAKNVPNPIWFDFERSTDTLKAIGMDHIPTVPIGPDSNPQEAAEFIKKTVKSKEYETIVFDTVSSSQIFQLTDVTSKANHELALIQDFRISTNYFSSLFFWLQHQPINVVLIGHERELYEGDLANRRKVGITMEVTPALAEATRQLTSNMVRLTREKKGLGANATVEWHMQVNSGGLVIAKNRCNIQEEKLINPTWDDFAKGMYNNVND